MLYAQIIRGKDNKILLARVMTDNEARASHTIAGSESRWDWKTFEAAKEVAAALGDGYIATDSGPGVSPRFDVIELPKVGDKVSYAFNGDYYPCGEIASISKSLRLIVTTEGQKFYRRGQTGKWIYNQTWSLVKGHISKLNPEF